MLETDLDVVGVGNAIVDVLAQVEESFIVENGLEKGCMALVDSERIADLRERMPAGLEVSGGSAANTIVGVTALGGRASYIGKVANDDLGRIFRRDLAKAGVLFEATDGTGLPTGCCVIQVTPDAQRTLNTHLGISAHLSVEDIDPDVVSSAGILYCEGYLWDTHEAKMAIRYAMETAHRAGRTVALALSDINCVDRHRTEWSSLLEEFVDVIFGNQEEVCSLYLSSDVEEALTMASTQVDLVFATLGSRGSMVAQGTERIEVSAAPVDQIVDTTGAGDMYASGVLLGISRGMPIDQAARLGSIAAAEIIRDLGARPGVDPYRSGGDWIVPYSAG